MTEEGNRFRVVAWWTSGRTGIAKSGSAPNVIHFTAPPAFGGLEGRWTPEDMLLSAIAGCYTTTFRTLAEYAKFEYTDLQIEAEGQIEKVEAGYNFSGMLIRANLLIRNESGKERALNLLQKAESLCLVTRALAVKPRFETRVQVSQTRVEASHSLPAPEKKECVG